MAKKSFSNEGDIIPVKGRGERLIQDATARAKRAVKKIERVTRPAHGRSALLYSRDQLPGLITAAQHRRDQLRQITQPA